jgi:hypothetical protein
MLKTKLQVSPDHQAQARLQALTVNRAKKVSFD